jgi:MSV199 domain
MSYIGDILKNMNSKIFINDDIIKWCGYDKMILRGFMMQLKINNIPFEYTESDNLLIVEPRDFKKYLMTLDTELGNQVREYYLTFC